MSNIFEKLLKVQAELNAPKNLTNKFGGYNYRSCEGILEAVKPLLIKHKATIVLNDAIVEVGGRVYVRAQAEFIDVESKERDTILVEGFAREEESKKGMDSSQLTGSTSSYARKYALNGLLCIDDAKDADHYNTGDKEEKPAYKPSPKKKSPEPIKQVSSEVGDKISPEQAKLLYRILAKKGEQGLAKGKEILQRFGYTSTFSVQVKDFNEIKKTLEGEL